VSKGWWTFLAAVLVGVSVFGIGFRLTTEVLVVLGLAAAAAFVFAAVVGHRPWLWGLGVGIGTRLFREPPLPPEHVAKYGASQPLPLPFGLTGDPLAEAIAGSLLIMAIPFVGAYLGWFARKVADAVTDATFPRQPRRT
jgi:hypothetical protein